jgi:hypothetical protein
VLRASRRLATRCNVESFRSQSILASDATRLCSRHGTRRQKNYFRHVFGFVFTDLNYQGETTTPFRLEFLFSEM